LVSSGGFRDHVAKAFEHLAEHEPDLLFIVHDQDARHVPSLPRLYVRIRAGENYARAGANQRILDSL
jgi:hypothetical protein